MKNLRAYVACMFAFALLSCKEANAVLGFTHVTLGNAFLDSIKADISDEDRNAFLSGEVWTDIGRIKYDNTLVVKDGKEQLLPASDSKEFIKEMSKHVKTKQEEWFVCGFILHYMQDRYPGNLFKGSFKSTRTSYLHYGIMDNYFKEKNKAYISSSLNKEEFLSSIRIDGLSKMVKEALAEDKNSELGSVRHMLQAFIISPEFLQRKMINYRLESYFSRKDLKKLVVRPQYELLQRTYASLGLNLSIDDIKQEEATFLALSMLMATYPGGSHKSENFEENVKSCTKEITEKSTQFILEDRFLDPKF